MMSFHQIIGLVIGIVLLCTLQGCSPYYAFGNSGIDPIVFNKPLYADSTKVISYIGGKYTQTVDSAYSQKGETNYFGQLYWAQTYTKKYYNYSYGAFGYVGSYKVLKVAEYTGNKSYYGGGFSGEMNFNLPLQTVDIRFVGIRGTLFYENGEFTRFRSLAYQQHFISGVISSKLAYNISCTQSCDFKLKCGSLGVDISTGFTHFIHDNPEFFTSSMNLHYTYKQYSVFIENTNSFLGIGDEFAVGFNYRIKCK